MTEMKRRRFLAISLVPLSVSLNGCLQTFRGTDSRETENTEKGRDSTKTENDEKITVEERTKQCEKQYIKNVFVTDDDERLMDSLHPRVIDIGSHSEGVYVALQTVFGIIRSSDDAPDEIGDYVVTAYYLVTDDKVYRTDEPEEDPRSGTVVDC